MAIMLHEKSCNGNRTILFNTPRDRGRYLAQEKNKARAQGKEFTFKRNEYLRVYDNAKIFYELDIIKPKPTKESFDALFKPRAVA